METSTTQLSIRLYGLVPKFIFIRVYIQIKNLLLNGQSKLFSCILWLIDQSDLLSKSTTYVVHDQYLSTKTIPSFASFFSLSFLSFSFPLLLFFTFPSSSVSFPFHYLLYSLSLFLSLLTSRITDHSHISIPQTLWTDGTFLLTTLSSHPPSHPPQLTAVTTFTSLTHNPPTQ